MVYPKIKTESLFTFFLLLNTKGGILENVGNQTVFGNH